MTKLYFYFGSRHYQVIDNKVLPFYDSQVDRVEISISWMFNNKPLVFCHFNKKEDSWSLNSLNQLLSDLEKIERELIHINYRIDKIEKNHD